MLNGSPPDPPTTLAIRSACRLFRDALALWLAGHAGFRVAGKVGTDGDLLDLCRLRPPELVVFDAAGATSDPLGDLRDHVPPARIVVLHEPLSSPRLVAAGRQGAALVPYSHGLQSLLAVLRRVADEQRLARARPPGRDRLTDEECEIIGLIAAGTPAHRIADLLAVTPGSVESAKRRIFQKLRVISQSQAIVRAVALGLGPAGGAALDGHPATGDRGPVPPADATGVRHPALDRHGAHRPADRPAARHRGENRGEHPGAAVPQARRPQPAGCDRRGPRLGLLDPAHVTPAGRPTPRG